MLTQSIDFDVVIVGGGIPGSTLACLLGQDSGLRVALLESQAAMTQWPNTESCIDGFDVRVSAITRASQQLLDSIGAWSLVANSRVSPYREMHVWDAEGTGSIHFNAAQVQQESLGHIVENRIMLAALQSQLTAHPSISRYQPVTVEHIESIDAAPFRHQIILGTGQALRSRLLVGADGAQSMVRRSNGFKTREWDYEQQALVATVRTELPHQATAWQRFLSTGPLAFLPLESSASQAHCSVVWSMDPPLAKQRMEDSDDEFKQHLAAAFEHRLGDIVAVSPRFSFPLTQRHATDYTSTGVALVADAAHTLHPLAGQGMNLGLADVAVLAEELRYAQQRNMDIGSLHVLRRYQRRRKGHNLGMMAAMEGFKRLFGNDTVAVRLLRNMGMSYLDQFTPLKSMITRQAMGL